MQHLKDALDENADSNALFVAAGYTLRMRGYNAVPIGLIAKLMQRTSEQGSVTPREIDEVLDSETVGVEYESQWSMDGE